MNPQNDANYKTNDGRTTYVKVFLITQLLMGEKFLEGRVWLGRF